MSRLRTVDLKACDDLRKVMKTPLGPARMKLLGTNYTTEAQLTAAVDLAMQYFRDALDGCDTSLVSIVTKWMSSFGTEPLAKLSLSKIAKANIETNARSGPVYTTSDGQWFLSSVSGSGILDTTGVSDSATILDKVLPFLYGAPGTSDSSSRLSIEEYVSRFFDTMGPVGSAVLGLQAGLKTPLDTQREMNLLRTSSSGKVGTNLGLNVGQRWKSTCRNANDPKFAPFYSAVSRFAAFINQPGDSFTDVTQVRSALQIPIILLIDF